MLRILKVFAAGIVLGVLYAPQSGEKTRKKLGKLFSDYKEDAKDYVLDVADGVESKVKSAKKAVKKL
ncbi:MAG: YtxH domain-containing protein [Ginsengibacter sp.]